jgi:hypothetical protein
MCTSDDAGRFSVSALLLRMARSIGKPYDRADSNRADTLNRALIASFLAYRLRVQMFRTQQTPRLRSASVLSWRTRRTEVNNFLLASQTARRKSSRKCIRTIFSGATKALSSVTVQSASSDMPEGCPTSNAGSRRVLLPIVGWWIE